MGLFKDYVSQTRKPEGVLEKLLLGVINIRHYLSDYLLREADWAQVFQLLQISRCKTCRSEKKTNEEDRRRCRHICL